MNYAMFGEWVRDRVEELVGFGVPRGDAEEIAHYLEASAIAAEATSRSEAQFLLDFKRVGVRQMAERHQCSPQMIYKRRTKMLKRNNHRLRARLSEPA